MTRITLGQLLQYFSDSENPDNRIQIVTRDQDWKDADEIRMCSELLNEFSNYIITDMGYEKSFYDSNHVLRVSIDY